MVELVGDADNLSKDSLVATGETDRAVVVEGGQRFYVAVPKTMLERATGEFTKADRVSRWFLSKPTAVWRALVLNLRPAWLVNNIVGNHLLYALRFAGPNGLRAYARAVKDAGHETSEFKRLVEKYLPEQVQGTFLGSQRPGTRSRLQNVASAGLAPLDIASEQMLRRAAVETVLRKSPEVRAIHKAMPKETRRFEQAARQALEQSPDLARRVSNEVNAALGNFLDLSPFERQFVRSVFPFYAWYRAITTIVARMPLEIPGRADAIARLGQVGADETERALGDIPGYLKGLVPVGGNDGVTARVFNATPLNPLGTVPQLGEDISGTVNPFIAGLSRALLGASKYDHVSPSRFVADFAGGISDVATGLPQVRLAKAGSGSLYRGTPGKPTLYGRNARDELLAYLGVPYRKVNLQRARELAERERRR